MCEAGGVFTAAEVVDHIVPVRDRPDLRLEPFNLQSLCRAHNARKATIEKKARRGRGGVEAFSMTPKTTTPSHLHNNPDFFSPAGANSEADSWPW